MKRPYDTIKGEPIDLNNKSHVDEIIKRNKKLEIFTREGIELTIDCTVKITAEASFECPKCGTLVFFRNNTRLSWLCR